MQAKFEGVGRRIASRLLQLRKKQADLCRDTGISSNAISQYVTGKRLPDTTALFTISVALGTTMEWLLTGAEYTTNVIEQGSYEVNENTGIELRPIEETLLLNFRQLNERDQLDITDCILHKLSRTFKKGEGSAYRAKSSGLISGNDTVAYDEDSDIIA